MAEIIIRGPYRGENTGRQEQGTAIHNLKINRQKSIKNFNPAKVSRRKLGIEMGKLIENYFSTAVYHLILKKIENRAET